MERFSVRLEEVPNCTTDESRKISTNSEFIRKFLLDPRLNLNSRPETKTRLGSLDVCSTLGLPQPVEQTEPETSEKTE